MDTKKTRARMPRDIKGPNKHSARQIQLLRKQSGFTQAELAKKIEVHQATVSKWELGDDIPSGDTLAKLAVVLETSSEEILGIGAPRNAPVGRTIQVIGEIAAGAWAETHELDEPFPTIVPGLPSKYDRMQLQGFRVKGDSMNLIYPDGSIVYIAPIGAVSGWPKPGQVVMVMSHKQGLTEATLKEYVVNEHGKWLYPRSNHPAHQQPVDYKNAGAEEVVITGVVIAATVFAD